MEEDKTRNLFIDVYKRCCWFYNIGARVIFHPEALKNRDDRKKKKTFSWHTTTKQPSDKSLTSFSDGAQAGPAADCCCYNCYAH